MSEPAGRPHLRAGAISTQRLLLRRFEAADLPAFVGYRSDPAVAAYQSWSTDFGRADAEAFLAGQRSVTLGEPGPWVQLAVADRASGGLHGDCAVRVLDDQPATAEVGVTLAPASQGHGYAGEALRALLDALFTRYALHRVYAEADDRNTAVHRLLAGLGMRCEARLVEADWFKGEWTTLRTYAVLAREWSG